MYRNVIVKLCEMMGISYAVSGYDIASSTEFFTICFTGASLQLTFAPGYLFLHHFFVQWWFYDCKFALLHQLFQSLAATNLRSSGE